MGLPLHKASPSGIGKCVDPALDPNEPAVDVAQQNLRRVRHRGFRSLGRAGAGSTGQGRRARQGLLAIGSHDRSWRVLPPEAGSPLRRRCSSTILERRFASRRGRQGTGSTNTSTLPELNTVRRPSPSNRHSFFTLGSDSRPRPRAEARTASQTSSQAAERSTACKTNSSVKLSFSSPIISAAGVPRSNATRSQPHTSPLTSKPNPSRKRFTGK